MRRLFHISLLAYLFLIFFYSHPHFASAQSKYSTSYETTYKIDKTGLTNVTQKVNLKNKSSAYYPSSYSIAIEGTKPQSIFVRDSEGPLSFEIVEAENKTLLDIKLRHKVVGNGKSQSLELFYLTHGMTKKVGEIWQIQIPKTTDPRDLVSQTQTIFIPLELGLLSYISPQPDSSIVTKSHRVLTFKTDQNNSGIIAAFGSFQVYNFTLKYHLANSNRDKLPLQEIALPPDTAYQRMFYKSIEPAPTSIHSDSDGNWIAAYSLEAKTRVTVVVKGQIHVYSSPQPFPQSPFDPANYLIGNPTWDTNDVKVKSLATKFKTPQSIYNLVLSLLSYDYQAKNPGPRKTPQEIFENPKGSTCQEFTDLFISLSRAAGIPAREITGFGYTLNPFKRPLSLSGDVLHAWPEYYDTSLKTWIAVDPTWGETTGGEDYFNKLDTEHITFAIHGRNPNYPKPAGSYKLDLGMPSQDIDIVPGEASPTPAQSLGVKLDLPFAMNPLKPLQAGILVTNSSPFAIYRLNLSVTSDQVVVEKPNSFIAVFPPFAVERFNLKIGLKTILNMATSSLSVTIGSQKYTFRIPILRLAISVLIVPVLSLTSIMFLSWSYYLLFKRKKHDHKSKSR